ncbi:o-succinylbenzoate synthase [Rahnella sp. AA]|uniref:o-succinylbenzoate synthase n=1 Tax=Rahnella sp. AA TaxID=2057180 RepID=UPI000C34BB3B|nr:o-succinylbenzoate synthase [Rahnella sp. AA]PKE31687.1 o-succinylbenzoate synthase [Rahnella sp. AA]
MRRAMVYRYSVPMEAGVVLRNQRLKTRDGLLVSLWQDDKTGWGEIAPLPGFSLETLTQAQDAVRHGLSQWIQGASLKAVASAFSTLPSVAFGLSCADAELRDELPPVLSTRCAPLCHGDPNELYARLGALPADLYGKKVAKVKVGLYEAVGDGLNVSMLLEALPDLHLRLDANRSWTPVKAEGFARHVAPELRSRIAFIEEPCLTREQSRDFTRLTGIAIAWDESVREAGFTVEAEPGLAAIIIKPTLTGSLMRCRQLIAKAHAAGLEAIISSSIESSLGLTQLARIAQWLTPDAIPGLDTLDLMQTQLVRRWPDSVLPLTEASELEILWQSK